MQSTPSPAPLSLRLVVGLAVGAAIAFVDNVAFGGEVSPAVIVLLLLAAAGLVGTLWGHRSWIVAALTWALVPGTHLVKHLLGLPDTLQPDTYPSILKLAAFTLVVTATGSACGVLLYGFLNREV